jgi:predicted ATP-grasp superfamily ATP-dependent carboligase
MTSVVVLDEAEARAAVARVVAAGGSTLLQELLPGDREAIWLFYAGDRFVARFAQIAYRMNPPLGGSSVLRESIPLPRDSCEAAEALVAAAGLDGYSEIEFRRDANGVPKLMEINPRLSASIEVAVRAGIDFPQLIYRWAAGLPVADQGGYRHGVRMRWFGGDVRWLRETLQTQGRPDILPARRAIGSFVGDCFRPAGYDYLMPSDLRPALVAVEGFLAKAVAARKAASRPQTAVTR